MSLDLDTFQESRFRIQFSLHRDVHGSSCSGRYVNREVTETLGDAESEIGRTRDVHARRERCNL